MDKTMILAEMLGCGYADIDEIEKLLISFEVDESEIDWRERNANEIIDSIFNKSLIKLDINLNDNNWSKRVSIYTNCLDSHLYIDNQEVFSAEEIRELLSKEKESEEDEEED
jgi:hypothetical protein